MRRAAKIDSNQHEIIDVFKRYGFSVLMLHQLGHGCPDILIGKHKQNTLVEIKDGNKSKSKRKLTEDQQVFHETWKGSVYVVESIQQAIDLALIMDQNFTGEKDETRTDD